MKWFISGVVLLGLGVAAWLFRGGEQIGELVADQGRDHVGSVLGVEYNSSPPTSGPHYAQWTKRGVYEEPMEDGYLIHSLEHGYVVISYDCTKLISNFQFPIFKKALAHEGEDDIPEGQAHEASGAGELNKDWQSEECKQLKGRLGEFYEKNKRRRLIIVPRLDLKTKVAMTAWNRLLTMEEWDETKANEFIEAWENKGPERTME